MYCYNCGTELPDGSLFCSSCGQRLGDLGKPEAQAGFTTGETSQPPPQYQPPPTYTAPQGYYNQQYYDPNVPSQFTRPERDRYGYRIPAEYPPSFDRNGFSWPAFWFPVIWYCYKGMYIEAWRFLLIGLIPYVGGLVASIWAGIVGYKEYSDFLNNTPPYEIERKKSTGMGCMIAIIVFGLVGIAVYIFWAVMMVGVAMSESY